MVVKLPKWSLDNHTSVQARVGGRLVKSLWHKGFRLGGSCGLVYYCAAECSRFDYKLSKFINIVKFTVETSAAKLLVVKDLQPIET